MGTSTLDISEARKQFSQLDKRLREDRVIWITRHNKKAFAVVDTDLLQTVLETIEILSDPDAWKMLQDGLRDSGPAVCTTTMMSKASFSVEVRVHIRWTKTAKESLKGLPLKVRKGLLEKADELADGPDPRERCKPLTRPLQGYYRIVYSRYRAIFSVKEEKLADGDKLLHLEEIFIAAGIRRNWIRRISTAWHRNSWNPCFLIFRETLTR